MSMRYKGGVISATPPTTSQSSASGSWTLSQQMQATGGGNWPRNGPFNYIEDVFSTWLYTGNASTQTVTNGIDLAGKGGMVWIKSRSGAFPHNILDTVRGFNYSGTQTRRLDTATQDSEADAAGNATQATPLSNGFSVTTSGGGAINFYNASGSTYASWTFREQPKFFDVVTFTSSSSTNTNQRISHSLGSAPGMIIIKSTDTGGWVVYHRSLNGGGTGALSRFLQLNSTAAQATFTNVFGTAVPTSTDFGINTNAFYPHQPTTTR